MKKFSYDSLKKFTTQVFLEMGCHLEAAEQATDVLLAADLRGIDSHGLARLSSYIRLWENDRINPTPEILVAHETPSTALLDGDRGLGLVVGPAAMRIAIEKAAAVGTGWVAVKNSNHYGIAGYHAMLPLEHDMIGLSMSNASPLVVPTFSKERLLGTNPIAVAFPAEEEADFVADFATTTAAYGKLELLQRSNAKVPSGWLQDANGNASHDPHAISDGGGLLPLGSDREHGSHKGYCLGAMVDIFSAVLSGANYGPWVPPYVTFLEKKNELVGDGIGHFFGALRIDAFRPADEFKSHLDKWIRRFRNAKPITGQDSVLIPGDPERETEKQRRTDGIPLFDSVVSDLNSIAEKFDKKFPT
ncbi:MAG: Ldh family oxidoreductase [Desulfofustis sp.]|nr:Ldh family oxidoreductase [Desulfofustis sp.]NNK57997.1 Ldh family oxidoreductase [Desulfofustis sp.]